MKYLLMLFVLMMMLTGCSHRLPAKESPSHSMVQNKVVVIIVDSLTPKLLDRAVQGKGFPALQYILSHGQYRGDVISTFPSMTVSDMATILTGTDPAKHRIPGLVWFDTNQRSIVNYGNNFRQTFTLGTRAVSENLLYNLNQKHLSQDVRTVFEDLHDEGYSTGAINMFVYRGRSTHSLNIPVYARPFTKINSYRVHGPDTLVFGQLTIPRAKDTKSGIFNGLGMNDDYATDTLVQIIKEKQLPDFTVVYLPDNDKVIHKQGVDAIKGITHVDQNLVKVLNSAGSWENTLKHLTLVMMGDSGVTPVLSAKYHPTILLHDVLPKHVYRWGRDVKSSDDLVVAANSRMAYIYLLNAHFQSTEVVSSLKREKNLDLIAWRDGKQAYVTNPANSDLPLQFHPDGPYQDQYGQIWSVKGNLGILDISMRGNHTLRYGKYPDAFHQLWSALHCQEGTYLVVTAKRGYQFGDDGAPVHPGGAQQASLLAEDVLAPIVVAGSQQRLAVPTRSTELKKYFISLVHVS